MSPAEWRCEQHPDRAWPHDDCDGPGCLVFAPHQHEYDERGFCRACRMTTAEIAAAAHRDPEETP